jgi:hypothetical protein
MIRKEKSYSIQAGWQNLGEILQRFVPWPCKGFGSAVVVVAPTELLQVLGIVETAALAELLQVLGIEETAAPVERLYVASTPAEALLQTDTMKVVHDQRIQHCCHLLAEHPLPANP